MKRRRSWQRGMRGQTLGSEDRMIALFEGFAADFQSGLCPLEALKMVNVSNLFLLFSDLLIRV